MKFHVENLGPIKKADFELGDFTVITGLNNTGKTYMAYAVYGFLKALPKYIINDLEINTALASLSVDQPLEIDLEYCKQSFISLIHEFSKQYAKNLHQIFSTNASDFKETVFEVSLNEQTFRSDRHLDYVNIGFEKKILLNSEEEYDIYSKKDKNTSIITVTSEDTPTNKNYKLGIKSLIYTILSLNLHRQPYIITAERTGIQIFQKELDINKNVAVESFLEKRHGIDFSDPSEALNILKKVTNRYSKPIKDSIDRVRDYSNYAKKTSHIAKDHPEILKQLAKVTGVSYEEYNGEYVMMHNNEGTPIAIPSYLASSSARALLDLHIFVKHEASKGQLLIIDEPELNLHPKAQVHLARLLASLSNVGVKVLITSHSDYIVKELNNLIMLAHDFEGKEDFKTARGYQDLAYVKNLNYYIAENQSLSKIDFDKFGLLRTSFDESIEEILEISDELYNYLDRDATDD